MRNKDLGAFATASDEDGFQKGLTKREYFAGVALQAVIASNRYGEFEIPYFAVKYADALLAELENKK
jgi:hypothetical protein